MHELIYQLSSLPGGWSTYHKHIVSKEIFKEIDYYLWYLQGKWCKHRHPNKPWRRLRSKYSSASGELCTFAFICLFAKKKARINKIFWLGYISILKHVKTKPKSNPLYRDDEKYFKQKIKELKVNFLKTKQKCIILMKLTEADKTLLDL